MKLDTDRMKDVKYDEKGRIVYYKTNNTIHTNEYYDNSNTPYFSIIKEMNEKGYDRGAVNKFDIDTAEAMKQVADISSSSMAKQVALSDSDKAVMIKDQSIMINRMRETMEKQAEELRLLREKHLKSELLDEYKKDLKDKGLNEEQIDRAVKEELDRRIPVV